MRNNGKIMKSDKAGTGNHSDFIIMFYNDSSPGVLFLLHHRSDIYLLNISKGTDDFLLSLMLQQLQTVVHSPAFRAVAIETIT